MEITGRFRIPEPQNHRMAEFWKHFWRSPGPELFRPFSEKLLSSQVTFSVWHLDFFSSGAELCDSPCWTLCCSCPPISQAVVPVHLFLKVPVDVSLTTYSISHSFWFCVNSKFSEATLCLITQVINEDFKQNWAQYWSVGYIACYWPPNRLFATDHHT